MITYAEFAEWAREQGLAPERCVSIDIVPASMTGRRDAVIWLRATQIVEDENGQFIVDTMGKCALEESVVVPLVSLP